MVLLRASFNEHKEYYVQAEQAECKNKQKSLISNLYGELSIEWIKTFIFVEKKTFFLSWN